MAIRRLNYTGRKRLRLSDVVVTVIDASNGAATFDASINLAPYRLPANAQVFVEAYRQTSWMRFDFGAVGQMVPPEHRTLTEFDTTEALLFRVRVASVSDRRGAIVAEASRIRPQRRDEAQEERVSLLPVKPDDDLEHEIARLEYSEQDRPLLLINSDLGDWRALALHPVFVSLVYPSALREILIRVLHVDKHFDTEDMEDWRSLWLRYASLLPGVGTLLDQMAGDQIDDWIDDAVKAFARNHRMRQQFAQYLSGEGNE